LPERREVVEDPRGAFLCRDYEIVVPDGEVVMGVAEGLRGNDCRLAPSSKEPYRAASALA
jgi:hypothetical protein